MYLTLHTMDWMQTREIAKHPEKWKEANPLLPDHPNIGEVNRHFLFLGLAHAAIANYLPKEKRELFQNITIGIESGIVARNYYIGIRF